MKKFISEYPELVKEWHPSKNGDLKTDQVSHGSAKKVWWMCPNRHSYEASPGNRTSKNPSGCPYCVGKRVCEDNNLKFLFPEIAKEWHPSKNGDLKPEEFTPGKNKKVWWLCPEGHSYYSLISPRTRPVKPSGCPYCSGSLVSEHNNLKFILPDRRF